jgi:Hg(II)-responsive transcriptional regulator
MKPLTIGALAGRAGVGVETVRFYERKGLVRRPPRPGTGFRVYPEDAVARIRFIRQAQTLGFTLQEIGGLLALRVTPGTDCAAVRTRAVAKRAIVERRLGELEKIRDALDKLIAACPGRGAVTSCTILETLADAAGPTSPTVRRRHARSQDMKSLALKIEGMHCDGCAGTVEALLAREPGVKGASVSHAAGKGQVLYDPATTDPARIAAAIERAGYRVIADPAAP